MALVDLGNDGISEKFAFPLPRPLFGIVANIEYPALTAGLKESLRVSRPPERQLVYIKRGAVCSNLGYMELPGRGKSTSRLVRWTFKISTNTEQ